MKKVYIVFMVLLAVCAIFLRFYRIPEYLMFLSDQGRDAIVLKRLVTLEKLVFVGPTTSIGNVFTGPFYYYLVAPFMLIFRLNPVGPAYGVALINSLGLLGVTVYIKKRYGKLASIIFLFFAGLSSTQIFQSRYSWNPNPVPLFTMLTLISWQQALESRKKIFFCLTGLLCGFSLQLHYITIVTLFPILLSLGIWVVNKREHPQTKNRNVSFFLSRVAYCFLAFVASFIPLILFEIRNHFINTRALFLAFGTNEVRAKTPYIDRMADTIVSFINHSFTFSIDAKLAPYLFIVVLVVLVSFFIGRKKKVDLFLVWLAIIVVSNILILALLEVGRHVHYFNPSYWAVYTLLSIAIASLFHTLRSKHTQIVGIIIIILILFLYARAQIISLSFLFEPYRKSTQISQAKEVATYIISQVSNEKYQVVGLPFFETEGHYRYFLEYFNRRPMSADTLGDPKELFVICHELAKSDCDIPGNAQWQLADFQNKHPNWKVASTKLIENVRIFKLIYDTK